ncbi:tyrosine-type recombinase/integrase [Corynebacterium halotolerans]|uniref:Integrase/recombinase n=1 Tax=Corynebacterium halotolerans YIM 70093 = DSM 44683 TaxID=1121362 RepID=M1NIA0_9CORY|nr:tyrosine-type recombinase/integrase [Corynebacterium halotolerans]AGF71133.1 integrase/recombinase [Corynebacterium halotolerans YIM 70093 = DSM 44683]AGF73045.1 integrase/recombinase [Corynebacterium halotolerans YIM 70093 = DSM 44683]
MTAEHEFTSAFAADLDGYLAFKEKMGFYGASRIVYLRRFDAYCTRLGRTVFDRATVEGWVIDELQRSSTYRSWMSYIRDFGRWLHTHTQPGAYILSDQWKSSFTRAHPYLLTQDEIDRFFIAAARLEAASPWAWQAAAFFTLMHSAGLRTIEARHLLTDQVDLAGGHIDIIGSKGHRSRRLPLTADVIDVLTACDTTSRAHLGPRTPFFVSSTGKSVTPATVGVIFNRIWDHAGLARPTDGRQPRPYDFRHHFAYANLERWMTNGTDITAMLPYLARYMGHATFDSTYYYVHTSPDFMNAYADITASQSQSLLPEVGFE